MKVWIFHRLPVVRAVLILLMVVLVAWNPGQNAHAAGVVGAGTPASCTDSAFANAFTSSGTITFNCGPNPVTIDVTTKVIGNGLNIVIEGGNRVTLDGMGTLQHFLVLAGGKLTLRNIKITNGSFGSGGAIYNQGETTLYGVEISESFADGGQGGAIYNQGTLKVTHSKFINNRASGNGGGIYNAGGAAGLNEVEFNNNRALNGGGINIAAGTTTITGTLFIGNGYASTVQGGGVRVEAGTASITNSTFAGNFAERGGGLYANAPTTVTNVTFYINRADNGGAIWNNSGVNIKNTILANSLSLDGTYTSLNCDGPMLTTNGYNLSSDMSCNSSGMGDLASTDPMLTALQDNGGFTLTHLPQAGSPAINAGTNSGCPKTDQRGGQRPSGTACDIGAVEVNALFPSLYLPLAHR